MFFHRNFIFYVDFSNCVANKRFRVVDAEVCPEADDASHIHGPRGTRFNLKFNLFVIEAAQHTDNKVLDLMRYRLALLFAT